MSARPRMRSLGLWTVAVLALVPPASAQEVPGLEDAAPVGDWVVWVIAVAAVLVVLVLGVVVGVRRQTPHAREASWRERALDVHADAVGVHEAARGLAADGDRRQVAQRLGELSTRLHGLAANPPDDRSAQAVMGVVTAARALRSALEADRSAAAEGVDPEAVIRVRTTDLGASLEALRSAGADDPAGG